MNYSCNYFGSYDKMKICRIFSLDKKIHGTKVVDIEETNAKM